MNQDSQFFCQKHSRLSYDICLHPSPMDNRLLCRFCKKELPQEKLLEVTSLSDFFSGNFLNAPKDLVEQDLKKSQQKMNQDTINAFFSDIEQGLLVALNQVKKKFFVKYFGNDKQVESRNQIKKIAEELSSELETFKADPQNKLCNAKFLNRFSQKYSLLINDSLKYVEQESTPQPNFVQNLDKFELHRDSYQNLKELCLRKISSFLEHYEAGTEVETSSDGYEDTSNVAIPVYQDAENEKFYSSGGEEEAEIAKHLLSPIKYGIRAEKVQKEPSSKKSTHEVETSPSEDSRKTVDDKKTNEVILEAKAMALKTVGTTRRVRRYQDSDDVSGDTKENCNGNTPVGPVLKKVKKSERSQENKIQKTIEIESPQSEEEKVMLEKRNSPNPREVSIQPIETLQGNYENVLWGGLCYIPDKKHIVAGDQSGNICVWDAESRESLSHKYIGVKIYKIIYLSLQGVILVSREDGEIDIFDVSKNYSLTIRYRKHVRQVFSMAYIKSLNFIASAGEEGNILLWSYSHSDSLIRPQRMLMTDNKQVSALCYVEDHDLLVAATVNGGYLMIFNPSVNHYIEKIKAHNKAKSIDCLLYVPAWKQVVSGSEDCSMKFWDFSNLSRNVWEPLCVRTLRRNASYIESMVAIPEANCLINTNLDAKLTVWDLKEMKISYEMMGSTKSEPGEALIYLEDRQELVTSFGSEIRLWKVKF